MIIEGIPNSLVYGSIFLYANIIFSVWAYVRYFRAWRKGELKT